MAKEKTSWNDLTRGELAMVAESYGVDVRSSTKKADLIQELDDLGITFESWAGTVSADEPVATEPAEPVVEASQTPKEDGDRTVLLKMNRKNVSYRIGSYKFTQSHPFVLVTEEDADYILENHDGFAMASPKELKSFYG